MSKTNRFSSRYLNLANPRLGAKSVFTTDEFFAPCERMLNPQSAVFIPDKFDENGKWMDGWETQRKRSEGHDFCIIKLSHRGRIKGVDIDTSHFCGNHPTAASVEACLCDSNNPGNDTKWTTVLQQTSLQPDSHHLHDIDDTGVYSHIRLNIYPDGGVARLRIYGEPYRDWENTTPESWVDLAALEHGGLPIACSNQAFGSSMMSLGLPGRGIDMGDGWETARRREPGNEWVIIKLGYPGTIKTVELDTAHYKGNFPDRASIQAGYLPDCTTDSAITQSMFWQQLLPETKLEMDSRYFFEHQLNHLATVTHVRVNIIPDGGLSRVRIHCALE